MADAEVDLFVIGAGSGGVRAARIAAGYGAKVMVAEEFRIGGTCVIRGCVPKKLYVYASRFADDFADAAGFGWTTGRTPTFDWPTLVAAKEKEITRLSGDLSRQSRRGPALRSSRSRGPGRRPHVRLAQGGQADRGAPHPGCDGRGTPCIEPKIPGLEHAITLERDLRSPRISAAAPDRRRRLYRGRVRQHLRAARRRPSRRSSAATTCCAASTTTCATALRRRAARSGRSMLRYRHCPACAIEKTAMGLRCAI